MTLTTLQTVIHNELNQYFQNEHFLSQVLGI